MLWVRGDCRAQLVCGGGDGGPIHENQRQTWRSLGYEKAPVGRWGEVHLEERRQQKSPDGDAGGCIADSVKVEMFL